MNPEKSQSKNEPRLYLQVGHTTKAMQYKPLQWAKLITTALWLMCLLHWCLKESLVLLLKMGYFAKHFDL